MSGNLASAAFRLARRGIAVFPLAEGAKVPMAGTHGFKDATADPDVTRARWQRSPHANIAAATGSKSGFWVLDVDLQHDGLASLALLEAKHGSLPLTIESSTPSGGRHLFFGWSASCQEIRCSTSRVGPGLDVKAEGGSITMPPSVLADGRCYRWAKNGATGFAGAPGWLIRAALPPPAPLRREPLPPPKDCERYVAAAVAAELRELEQAANGSRNHTLFKVAASVAGFVLAGALPEDWARRQLENRAINIGLAIHEADRTISSAFRVAQPRELPR